MSFDDTISYLKCLFEDDSAILFRDFDPSGFRIPSISYKSDGFRKAAVAVIILQDNIASEARLVLMKRKSFVGDPHSGQISFPGGGFEIADKDLVTTALRETEEEIGLPAGNMNYLGALPDVPVPVSKYIISPFVFSVSDMPSFRIDESEVQRVLTFPLELLLYNTRLKSLSREVGRYGVQEVNFFDFGYEPIWGATAFILYHLKYLLELKTTR